MLINLEAFIRGFAFDLNYTIRENVSYNRRTNPLWPKFTIHETKLEVIQQLFVSNHKLLSS